MTNKELFYLKGKPLTLFLCTLDPPTLVIADGEHGYTVAPVNPVPHGSPLRFPASPLRWSGRVSVMSLFIAFFVDIGIIGSFIHNSIFELGQLYSDILLGTFTPHSNRNNLLRLLGSLLSIPIVY